MIRVRTFESSFKLYDSHSRTVGSHDIVIQTTTITDRWHQDSRHETHNYQWDYVVMVDAIGAYCYESFEEDLVSSMVVQAHQLGAKVVPWHLA